MLQFDLFFFILLAQNPVVGEKKENIGMYLEHGKLTAQMGILSSYYFANYFSSYLQNLNCDSACKLQNPIKEPTALPQKKLCSSISKRGLSLDLREQT